MLRVCTQKVTKDKDKEALFNVAYLKQINISSVELLLRHNIFLTDAYLPYSIFPFYARVSKGAASTIFYTFGMVPPGLELTTSRSESGRSTN